MTAATLSCSVILSAVLAGMVTAAPGDVNDVCDQFTCKSPATICDILTGTCRLKVGENCRSDACVISSSCVSNICTCQQPNSTVYQGQCAGPARTVGGTCNPSNGTSACIDSNAICHGGPDVGVCVCRDYVRPEQNGSCPRDTNIPVGSTNGPCHSDGLCDSPREECDNGRCRLRLGEDCSVNSAACTSSTTCVTGVCTCLPPRSVFRESCLDLRGLDIASIIDVCNSSDASSCSDTNARCVGNDTKVCACNPGYTVSNEGQCVPGRGMVGGACIQAEGRNVCLDSNATCLVRMNTTICECEEGFFATSQATCNLIERTLGGTCKPMEGAKACDDKRALCMSKDGNIGICECKDESTATADGKCSAAAATYASILLLFVLFFTSRLP